MESRPSVGKGRLNPGRRTRRAFLDKRQGAALEPPGPARSRIRALQSRTVWTALGEHGRPAAVVIGWMKIDFPAERGMEPTSCSSTAFQKETTDAPAILSLFNLTKTPCHANFERRAFNRNQGGPLTTSGKLRRAELVWSCLPIFHGVPKI